MDQAFVLAEAARLVQSGRKIEAIKQVREAFGMGLKEAKDVVDAIERHETVHLGDMSTSHVHLESVTAASPTPTANKGRGCFLGIFLLAILVFVGIGAASVLLVGREETTIEGVVSVIEESLGGTAVSIELDEIEIPPIPTVSIESIFPTIESQVTAAPAFAEVVHEFGGEEGIGPGFFNDTRRLAVDGAGNIYTGD
ncbi:MAG: hypothetical protein GY943_32290 [Chloroflexi bacterium]|nr:hypothetical protein [Chloroflexota bacterium]